MESSLDKNNSFQDDSERNNIRSELSKMSFEDLQKLKAKLGYKVYKEAMYGAKLPKNAEFKRKNKNRPREASSKVKPVVKSKVKEKRIVDPRFDRLCGTYNEKHFRNAYGFISDIRKEEKTQLKKMLKKGKNPNEMEKIEFLIKRMDNQEREENRRLKQQEREQKEKEEKIKELESGKKPYFRTKFEKKIVGLVDKYSDLKKHGKVQRYIEKKQKKLKSKAKGLRYFDVKISDSGQE